MLAMNEHELPNNTNIQNYIYKKKQIKKNS